MSIKNVAIVGAGGNSGKYMTESLLATGKHTVTAITRPNSTSVLPEGVKVAHVDYDNPASIVEALKGQDALIITMGVTAPKDSQSKLIQAAADANVPWVLPNAWSPDSTHEGLRKDVGIFEGQEAIKNLIAKIGKSSYMNVTTGFWYEWSVSIAEAYGIDFANKKVTFFDDGETKITTTTWPQVGRGVAALMSLPEEELEKLKNKTVFISSFTVSQKDMLDSVLRVTGDKIDDWTVTKEPATERFKAGVEAMMKGDRMGFLRMMYTRVFYPDGNGDYETGRGTSNALLGLPKEDLDEATKAAIKRAEENPFGYEPSSRG
jgi:NAD(P)-dependent dehydrogenase (short-subunit alcohol dehydrogenase family)